VDAELEGRRPEDAEGGGQIVREPLYDDRIATQR
jgi:hypothetical protein